MAMIGERIRERRQELKMSLDDVSKRAGIPKSTIFRWETGAIKNMGYNSLDRVAQALETTVPELQGVTVTSTVYPFVPPDRFDVFEFLLAKCGYTYHTHVGADRYYGKNGRMMLVDDEMREELEKQLLPFMDYLFYTKTESIDDMASHKTGPFANG